MGYLELYAPYREEALERYGLAMERIAQIGGEETVAEPFRPFFREVASFILRMRDLERGIEDGSFLGKSLEEWKAWNEETYAPISPGRYGESYLNPAYACEALGEEYGQLLCALYAGIRDMAGYAAEQAIDEMAAYAELFIEIYNCFEEPSGTSPKEIRDILYWFYHDYEELFRERSLSRMLDPEDDFFRKIIEEADLTDLRYLYRFGFPVGENELRMAEYLNRLPEETIQAMADTYTEGYRIGFEVTRKDLSQKGVVEIYYPIGFERVVRAAIANFAKMGLAPTFRRGSGDHCVHAVSLNPQYDYDHKADKAICLDKAYVERSLECMRDSMERHKSQAARYAGPAVIDLFGREPFSPVHKAQSLEFDEAQQRLNVRLSSESGQIQEQYIPEKGVSFTIIAYPMPEIGPRFEEIFEKTIELNNLDYDSYRKMQQKLIDVLDQAQFVHVKGKGANRTDLTVAIRPLAHPERETAFENCVADVNIPVGEVFTSPQLSGTNGKLYVSQAYLNGLKYSDLELEFADGMVASCHCSNFADEGENQKFLKENLLFHHETLPMGEFAIGTNTVAYKMGRDYGIEERLPILIAEKTGPHFAVGDTCYSHVEDTPVYNPDGKEIVSRDNEVSRLRKEDPERAYFYCHTDITIPYDELDSITAITAGGARIPVIAGGRFVVPGTEELNVPLEELEANGALR